MPTDDTVNAMKCAAKGCDKRVTYEKPLCYPHWLEFDSFEIAECEKCHFFSTGPAVMEVGTMCWDCRDGEDVAIHDHAPIEVELQYFEVDPEIRTGG